MYYRFLAPKLFVVECILWILLRLFSTLQGDFDDAQSIVKGAFADVEFREEVKLGAINSINWARVLAQITYYFYSYLRVTFDPSSSSTNHQQQHEQHQQHPVRVSYAVPTGNFGDILAGYYAK